MSALACDREIAALLPIDLYDDFISEGGTIHAADDVNRQRYAAAL